MKIEILEGDPANNPELLTSIATRIFDDFDPAYIETRLPQMVGPVLLVARDATGPVAFKLGYREHDSFYSWLGGVDPRARRQGLASRLMRAQHDHVRTLGYRSVTTRTRAANRPMIILNLKFGFEIVGFEINGHGFAVVNQRKRL